MEGGIGILLLVILFAICAFAFNAVGGLAALREMRERRGRDRGPRPQHVVAEPTDEHAAGYGVQGEYDEPQPPRVRRTAS
jgi:hypothetical protein